MTMEPNKGRIKLWLDALVSGEFEQGRTWLHGADGRYCCLGVACAIASRNGGPGAGDVKIGNDVCFPSDEVKAWYGIDLIDSLWTAGDLGLSQFPAEVPVGAVTLNDGVYWSFKQIAAAFAKKFDIPGYELPEESGEPEDAGTQPSV
jgi:hypothetical protein